MAKRNLVIYGWGNSGKTTIINTLYDRLKMIDPNLIIYRKRTQLGKKEDNDFTITITYKGKSIVLYSAGDKAEFIDEAMDIGRNFDILVCTCNMRLYQTYKNKFNREIRKKQYRKNISEKNEKQTDEIIDIIEELIQEIQ